MKTLYLECGMGAAGDMLMAALLELHPDPDGFLEKLNGLGIPGVRVTRQAATRCGITGTHLAVTVHGVEEASCDVPPAHTHGDAAHPAHPHEEHAHAHIGLEDTTRLLAGLPLTERVRVDALAVYHLIAEAEGAVHGRAVESVHFHEVGAMDAVADIVGVCLLMEALAPQCVVASAVHLGSGQVRCAHGILPVPAPATASILKGVPTYGGQIQGELCTPTGAALLRHFVAEFGPQPAMAVEAIGYGMGTKEFAAANCLRAFLGERADTALPAPAADEVVELACNLDDMTGEALGFALETLLENGALDAWTVPLQMKKSRPGQQLACLCLPQHEEKLAALMLRHTTSFGLRRHTWHRHTLRRSSASVNTDYGPVRVKTGSGHGVQKRKAEYDDLARLAKAQGLTLDEVRRQAEGDDPVT